MTHTLYKLIDWFEEEMVGKSDEEKRELAHALMSYLSAYKNKH